MSFNVRLCLLIGALLAVFLWLIGNTLSDQYFVTQWLEWMPTLPILVLLAVISVGLVWIRAWNYFMFSACLTIAVGLWYSVYENKFFVPCGGSGNITLACC